MTAETVDTVLSLADVLRARKVLSQYLPNSPLVEAPALSERLDCRVYLKLDCMLPTGAFKVRGGVFLLSQLTRSERAKGIVAATRGNHGQSLAYACRMFRSRCRVFVPRGNSSVKIAAMRRLGAEVKEVGSDFDEACDAAASHARGSGAVLVHPGLDVRLFAGVGTWAVEALEQAQKAFDAVFVPVGVGSCLAGAIPVFEAMAPRTRLIGVSSAAAPAFALSLEAGVVRETAVEDTLADGLAVRRPPETTFRSALESGTRIQLVSEPEIGKAMYELLTREAVVAEGAAAATLAAAQANAGTIKGKNILLMVSGRNLDNCTLHDVCIRHGGAGIRSPFVAT